MKTETASSFLRELAHDTYKSTSDKLIEAADTMDTMLAALKKFKDFLETTDGHKHALATSNHPSGIAYRKVCAAIAKAEGR